MKSKVIRLFKIDSEFKLSEVLLKEPFIIGSALFGEGCLATPVGIKYQPLLDNLKENKIFSNFTMLVDEEGEMKELPLNFVGSFLRQDQLLGDVYICKVGKGDFVDMFDREYEIIKNQLLGLIDIITDEINNAVCEDVEGECE